MENSDTSEENVAYLSPKALIKARRRRSVLSSKRYFRKSMKHDHVEYTIPNESITIIEIGSSDDESSKTSSEIDESETQKKTFDPKDEFDSGEIIPTTENNLKNLKCCSAQKKRANDVELSKNETDKYNVKRKFEAQDIPENIEEPCRAPNVELSNNETDEHNVEKINEVQDIPENREEPCKDPDDFSELSHLDYTDIFRKRGSSLNTLMHSTMIQPAEVETNLLETDAQEKLSANESMESVNKSCENLLDDLYGDSWRPYRDKILPPSEKKPPAKKILIEKQVPATESKVKKKSVIHRNPYVENEKHKSNNLLRALQRKRMREATESPLISNLKALCDEESTERSALIPPPPVTSRVKLKFDEPKKLEIEEGENEKEKVHPKQNNDHDFCWSDKENSFEKLSLKERIERKKNTKEGSTKNSERKLAKESINRGKGTKKLFSSDENNDKIKSAKISSTSSSSESSNEGKKQNNQSFDKLELRNPKCLSSSSLESINSEKIVVKKRVMKKKILKRYLDSTYSSDEEDSTTKETPCPNDYLENNVKTITKKLLKTKIQADDVEKTPGKNIKKKVSKTRTKGRKSNSDYSSESDDSPVEKNDKLGLKTAKTDKNQTYSFLASLSSSIPNHQCDPKAKIFKANFKNTKETLANELYELYNKNIFNNLLPKTVPLEWNARMLCTAGYCNSKRVTHRDGKIDLEARIVLSTKVLTTPDRLRDTLIHEMCHAATWLIDKVRDGHGQYWKAWASKARRMYPELPLIKTCHNYELSSKYVYKCTGCGYEVKRHRKSLDIERKRCGYCCGKFEIFINKVNKKGEQKMLPLVDTPKKEPKGFAAFIQENFATYKTPRRTPAEVMKILSSKFKEMKVQ